MYYNKTELLQLIFKKFRQGIERPTSGYYWSDAQFIRFFNALPKPIEYDEFITLMLELCDDDIFEIAEQNKSNGEIYAFRLTDKGEKLLWNF